MKILATTLAIALAVVGSFSAGVIVGAQDSKASKHQTTHRKVMT